MAKNPPQPPIRLPCGACGGKCVITQQYKGLNPVTKKVETCYRTVPCPACGGKGFINK